MISEKAKAFLEKQGLKTKTTKPMVDVKPATEPPTVVEPTIPAGPKRLSERTIQHLAAEAQFVPRGMPKPSESDIPSGGVDAEPPPLQNTSDTPYTPETPALMPEPPSQPLVHPTTREGLESMRTEIESKIKEQTIEEPIGTDKYPRGAHHNVSVEDDFERAYDTQPNNHFIDELYTWWDEKGFLTAAQYERLYFIAYGRMYPGD